MNIKVLGWYNHGNAGDEAYKLAFPLLFPKDQVEFIEAVNDGDAPDVLILGGGDVFYPSFTKHLKNLPQSTRKIAASISLTENSDFPALQLLDRVYVRDYRSALLCNKHGVNGVYQPDFTFLLTPNIETGRTWLKDRFAAAGHELYDKVVVCVISNYLASAKLDMPARDLTSFLNLSQEIAKVIDRTPASFVFLPFSSKPPWDDRVSGAWVADRCKYYKKNLVIHDDILDVQTTLDVVAAGNATISSRLHASIFSTISGIPFIDLTRHTKNLGFIETVEKTRWSIPFDEFGVKEFRNTLNTFLGATVPDPGLTKFARLAKDRLRVATLL